MLNQQVAACLPLSVIANLGAGQPSTYRLYGVILNPGQYNMVLFQMQAGKKPDSLIIAEQSLPLA
jgi:hypothetical protein